ncbi:GH22477 [Drosophila grimshawi]|uniref:thioredoxin-dependent peroxiredoxin n=1 Tax=Drosophila grimshawi TaxID=7222 RepID=B4K2F2_DROGR|nr:GH22477 [Drosophila grimshawi]
MRLGQTIPNFMAETTKGPIFFHDWQGDSWVVLFSHPSDFTPVCTTELGRIAVHQPEFEKRNTKCLAHSVDPLDSHVDWDQKKDPEVAKTIRALFIISPDHKVRLSMFYPMSTGRNVDEILRTIDSLQLTDRLKVVATPANWTPGTKVMILPCVTDAEAHKIFPKGFDKVTMPSGVNYVRTTENY